jgi:hypothetical protein
MPTGDTPRIGPTLLLIATWVVLFAVWVAVRP